MSSEERRASFVTQIQARVVMPVLVLWGYNLLLEKEQFLWTKVIFQEILSLHLQSWGFGAEISFGKYK